MEISEETGEAMKDKLLLLIEEGDATVILSSKYTESLNELIKHEFISIENEALRLTDKGREAKVLGVEAMMGKTVEVEEEIKIKDFPPQKTLSGVSNRSFLILLFFFLISLLAMMTLINS